MARCKCKICGTQLNTTEAYKITDKNGKNKYYCSTTEYETEEARKKKAAEDKDRVYRLICDIMGEKDIINTILFKEWQIWLKVADNEKIERYLEENKKYLTLVISRLENKIYNRIRYLSAILKNNLDKYKPKVDEIEKPKVIIDETIYNTSTHSINRRRSLADLEDDI